MSSASGKRSRTETYLCKVFLLGSNRGRDGLLSVFLGRSAELLTASTFLHEVRLTRDGAPLVVNLELVECLSDAPRPLHFFAGANCFVLVFDRLIPATFDHLQTLLGALSRSLPNFASIIKLLVCTDLSTPASEQPKTPAARTFSRLVKPASPATSSSSLSSLSSSSSSSSLSSLSSSTAAASSSASLPAISTTAMPSPSRSSLSALSSPSRPSSSSSSRSGFFASLFSRSTSTPPPPQTPSPPPTVSQRAIDSLVGQYRLVALPDRPALSDADVQQLFGEVAGRFLAASSARTHSGSSSGGDGGRPGRGYQAPHRISDVLPEFPSNPWQLFNMVQSMRATLDLKSREDLRAELVRCIEADDVSELRKLIAGAEHDLSKLASSDGRTLLHSAARCGNTNALRELIGYGLELDMDDAKLRTPLHHAAKRGQLDTCHYLVAHGADPSVPDQRDDTPLHLLIARRGLALETDSMSQYLRLLMVMLRKAPELVDRQNQRGEAAVHLAAKTAAFQTLLLLVNYGHADTGLKTKRGADLLLCAVKQHCKRRVGFGNLKAIRFLLEQPRDWHVAAAQAYARAKKAEQLAKLLADKQSRMMAASRPGLLRSGSCADELSARIADYVAGEPVRFTVACSLCNPQRPGRLFATRTRLGFFHESGDESPTVFAFADVGAICQGRAITGDDLITLFFYDRLPQSFVGFVAAHDSFALLTTLWTTAPAALPSSPPSLAAAEAQQLASRTFAADLQRLIERGGVDALGFPHDFFAQQLAALRRRHPRRQQYWPAFIVSVTGSESLSSSLSSSSSSSSELDDNEEEEEDGVNDTAVKKKKNDSHDDDQRLQAEWQRSGLLADSDALRTAQQRGDPALRRLLERGGAPATLRPDVWFRLSGAARKQELAGAGYWQRIVGIAGRPCEEGSERQQYRKQIGKDVQRTGTSHALFRGGGREGELTCGEQLVYEVLLAYEVRDGRVGYTQSMNVLAKFLLLVFRDAERTFWMLCALLDDYLPGTFGSEESSSLLLLAMDRELLLHLLRRFLPELVALHSDEMDWFWVDKFFPTWMLCLFCHESTRLPTPTLLWAWDYILAFGIGAVFDVILTVLRVALPMIVDEAGHAGGASIADCVLYTSFSLADAGAFRRAVADTRRLLAERRVDVLAARRELHCATFPSRLVASLGALARERGRTASSSSSSNSSSSSASWRLDTATVAPADFVAEVNKFANGQPHLDFQSFRQLVVLFSFDQTCSESEVELDIMQRLFIVMDTDRDGFVDYFELLVGMLFATFASCTLDAHLDFAFELIAVMKNPPGQTEAIDSIDFDRFLRTCYALAYQSSQYAAARPPSITALVSPFEFKQRLSAHRSIMTLFARRIIDDNHRH